MKPNSVATLYAGQLKAEYQALKNLGTALIMSMLLIFISCDKSDDLDIIVSEPPIVDQPPTDDEPPADDDSPTDEEPPIDDESPEDDESVIVYTDIEPDFTGINLNDCYNLDLNNDQIFDFSICSGNDNGWEYLVIVSIANSKNSIISVAPWYSQAVPLDHGNKIFTLAGYRNGEHYETWGLISIGDCFGGEQYCFYDWKSKVDKYLGLRFIINGQKHYGWAQLEVVSATKWFIKDYAYNATPNMPILAGQKE